MTCQKVLYYKLIHDVITEESGIEFSHDDSDDNDGMIILTTNKPINIQFTHYERREN